MVSGVALRIRRFAKRSPTIETRFHTKWARGRGFSVTLESDETSQDHAAEMMPRDYRCRRGRLFDVVLKQAFAPKRVVLGEHKRGVL
jgi:hypothetical protein